MLDPSFDSESAEASPETDRDSISPRVPSQQGLEWLAEYGDRLYSYALYRVRSPEIAEELVQETFLAAVRSPNHFAGRSSRQTWLLGILRHKLVDHYRRVTRKSSLESLTRRESGDESTYSATENAVAKEPCYDPTTTIESEELQTLVRECIEDLPPLIRQAFEFRVLDQLEREEVCALQQITSNNLASRIYRARMFLRECIEKHWR